MVSLAYHRTSRMLGPLLFGLVMTSCTYLGKLSIGDLAPTLSLGCTRWTWGIPGRYETHGKVFQGISMLSSRGVIGRRISLREINIIDSMTDIRRLHTATLEVSPTIGANAQEPLG